MNAAATSTARSLSRLTGKQLELVVKHLPRTGRVTSHLPNGEIMRLWSRGDDWICTQVYWRGWDGYEPEMSRLYYRFAQKSALTVDVGAHVGFYSVLAGLANPRGHVFAFEPMPTSLARLVRHLTLNRLRNVEPVAAAVAESGGTAEFFHVRGNPLPCSASLAREFMSFHSEVDASPVPTVALDVFLRERGVTHVDLVKLDIETMEPAALRGMAQTLARDMPSLFCEVLAEESATELEDLLLPIGYRFYHLMRDGPCQRHHIRPDPNWPNYLFTILTPHQLAAMDTPSAFS